jgi:hypothetical protein
VQVQRAEASKGEYRVWISGTYLDGVKIDDVSPTPDATEASDGGILYRFLVDRGDLKATFDLTGDAIGALKGSVGLGGRANAVDFSQFFYP